MPTTKVGIVSQCSRVKEYLVRTRYMQVTFMLSLTQWERRSPKSPRGLCRHPARCAQYSAPRVACPSSRRNNCTRRISPRYGQRRTGSGTGCTPTTAPARTHPKTPATTRPRPTAARRRAHGRTRPPTQRKFQIIGSSYLSRLRKQSRVASST